MTDQEWSQTASGKRGVPQPKVSIYDAARGGKAEKVEAEEVKPRSAYDLAVGPRFVPGKIDP